MLSGNSLIKINLRAHEVQYEGYRMYNWKTTKYRDRERNFPQVITIFSAPKYSDSYNNKGAIIKFEVSKKITLRKMHWIFNNLNILFIRTIFQNF